MNDEKKKYIQSGDGLDIRPIVLTVRYSVNGYQAKSGPEHKKRRLELLKSKVKIEFVGIKTAAFLNLPCLASLCTAAPSPPSCQECIHLSCATQIYPKGTPYSYWLFSR